MTETTKSGLHGLISYFDGKDKTLPSHPGVPAAYIKKVSDRWAGKVAVVTGASAGIGEAIAESLVICGLKVVAIARRAERLEALEKKLVGEKGKLYPLKVDLTKEEEIFKALPWIEKNVGAVHILINNAGRGIMKFLDSTTSEDWRSIYELNVVALTTLSREVIKSMKQHNIEYGQIINVSSVAGKEWFFPLPQSVPYFCTKRAVNAISEGLRLELAVQGTKVKVTNLTPGLVQSEFRAVKVPAGIPVLEPEDLAHGVVFILSTPPHLVVTELTLQPLGESNYTLAATRYAQYKKT